MAPVKLDVQHFDCGDDDLNDFLKNDAIYYTKNNLAVTYLVADSDKVVSYMSLAVGAIEVKKHLFEKDIDPRAMIRYYPCLKIARLATDKRYQGKGYAAEMIYLAVTIAKEIRKRAGCRFLMVDAYPDPKVVNWYKKRGFVTPYSDFKGMNTVPMYLILE